MPPQQTQDVLHLYLELQERKMNMWAQQKALEERKTERRVEEREDREKEGTVRERERERAQAQKERG